MSAPRTPDAKLVRAVEILNEVYAAGFAPNNGAMSEAAKRAQAEGVTTNRTAFWSYLDIASQRLGLEPDETLYRPARFHQPTPRAVIFDAAPPVIPEPQGESRVLVIGDLHQDPRHPHRLGDSVLCKPALPKLGCGP